VQCGVKGERRGKGEGGEKGGGGREGGFAIFPPHTIINQQYYLPIQNIYHIAVW